MTYLLTFITAMVVSMAIIPLMARLAPRIGMIDRPDARKVHRKPVPRVGGVGIVLGTLAPLVLWLPYDEITLSYMFGALVLFVFGAWDDARPLNHLVKFSGQFIAVMAVVYYGDLYIGHLPFAVQEVNPDIVGKPFTVFAIVGMINALNTSDGLDGLAGGLSLLSLACIGYLSFMSDDFMATSLVLAMAGGVIGFLRYNTHPAKVFMGDSGSQFLGFTLGVLAVLLTQKVNPAVSPVLPLLFLGLPIIDLLAVVVQRYHRGAKWYLAHKDHVHHRLLALGFDHYESVVIIYSIQTLLVVSAIFMLYESDALLFSFYLGVCVMIFALFTIAERSRWRAHKSKQRSRLAKIVASAKRHPLFIVMPMRFVTLAVIIMFMFAAFFAPQVPRDVGAVSAVLALMLVLYLALRRAGDTTVLQVVTYVTAAFAIYLETSYCRAWSPTFDMAEIVYFTFLAVAMGVAIRSDRMGEFKTTPMDYLIVFMVLFVGILLHNLPDKAELGGMVIKLMIIFYACELIITRMRRLAHLLTAATLVTLTTFAVRGLV